MYSAIVFLPLLGAIIAGMIAVYRRLAAHLGCRRRAVASRRGMPRPMPTPTTPRTSTRTPTGTTHHEPAAAGSRAAEIVTSGFLVISAILSWVAFITVGFGEDAAERVQIFNWFSFGHAVGRLGVPDRYADGGDAGRGDDGVVARPHLLDRLHGARPAPAAVLRLPVAVHLRDAGAGDRRQPRPALLRLGGRGSRLLSAHRLLVQAARRPTPRRSRRSSSTASATSASRSASSRSSFCSTRSSSRRSSPMRRPSSARRCTSCRGTSTR